MPENELNNVDGADAVSTRLATNVIFRSISIISVAPTIAAQVRKGKFTNKKRCYISGPQISGPILPYSFIDLSVHQWSYRQK